MSLYKMLYFICFYCCLGSGTVATLVLALNLARLLRTSSSSYSQYRYRVRFCWWGAEELGLIGSYYHIEQASSPSATIESGRVQDYLLYFNYDMLASPNSNFGILDSVSIPPDTPEQTVAGTDRITDLFQQWFNKQKLPWTESGIGGGSDFVPFLISGIASGGVNTGAGGIKSVSERDQYVALMGTGNGGIANAAYDSCYHQQCDRITNANPFAYEKVVKAAAYAIEYVGRLNDLEQWLYPQGRAKNVKPPNRNQLYDIHNDPSLF
jgi:Zn-dependent M28 family amino/carboxypeptidase